MQVTQKTQLNLFEPFFDKEIDYKNDYMFYIEVSGNSSVTPKNNNSENSLNHKEQAKASLVKCIKEYDDILKKINLLDKSKIKFDMAYALDRLSPNSHFTVSLDIYKKHELAAIKEEELEFLKSRLELSQIRINLYESISGVSK